MPKKTSLGLDENVEALLCYTLGWITGLIFILIEKENKTVRFHAFQSFVTFLSITAAYFIFAFIPLIGLLLNIILYITGIIIWIMGMIKSYQGEEFKVPIIGNFVQERLVG